MSATAEMTGERRASMMLRDSGYKGGGEVKVARRVAKRVVKRAISEHDKDMHGGKHEHLKLKSGGAVAGETPEARPDRRHAGGGKGKIGTVNIHVGNTPEALQAESQGRQQGTAIGAKLAGAAGPKPPMGPPPPGAAPMGAAPPRPMMPPPGGAPGMPPGGGAPPQAMRPPGVKRGGAVARMDTDPKGMIPPGIHPAQNDDEAPGNIERRASKDEFVEPNDEVAGRKRGGGVPGNLEKHRGTEFEAPAKEQAPRRKGGKC